MPTDTKTPVTVTIPVPDIVAGSNWLVQSMRGSVRPLTTLSFVGMFIWAGVTQNWETLPPALVLLGSNLISFWFGGRFPEKAAGQ